MTDRFEKSMQTLELPRVLDMLADQAVTEEGKDKARRLRPETDPVEVTAPAGRDHRRRGEDGPAAAAPPLPGCGRWPGPSSGPTWAAA